MNKTSLVILAALMLSACGAREEGGDPSNTATQFGPNGEVISGPTDPNAASFSLNVRAITDNNVILTGGSDVATITALVTNSGNQAVVDAPVSFTSTGGVLKNRSERTDENGVATATLDLLGQYRKQDIVVTVTADGNTSDVRVLAEGTEIEVAGPTSMVLGDVAELQISLTDGYKQPIANEPVTISSKAGNTVTPDSGVTSAEGRLDVSVTSTNGSDSITVRALDGTVIGMHDIQVGSDLLKFAANTVGRELAVDRSHNLSVEWVSNGAPVVGKILRFGITAGAIEGPLAVQTNAQGRATVRVRSSSAGAATVTVEPEDSTDTRTQVDIEFVAITPATLDLDVSSSRVPARGESTVVALVTDKNGNPVKGKKVLFTGNDLKGGQLSPAASVTNSDGEASVTFTAGRLATEVDEIELRAKVEGVAVEGTTRLTVAERRLNVTIGTSNFISERAANTQYAMPYVVQVADGGGAPLKDAVVTVSIRPTMFYKGQMVLVDDEGKTPGSVPNFSAKRWFQVGHGCEAEDSNGNRVLDPAEDNNGNGMLDPQDPASLVPIAADGTANLPTLIGDSVRTDATGSGYFEMIYPQSSSLWAEVVITARAEALGAEAEASYRSYLPLLATRINKTDSSPPNQYSPYGTEFNCSNTL